MSETYHVLKIKNHVCEISQKPVHLRRQQKEMQDHAILFWQQGLITEEALEAIMGNISVTEEQP